MQHPLAYYKELLVGYIRNTSSAEQVQELFAFIAEEPELYEQLMDDPELTPLIQHTADGGAVELSAAADHRIREYLEEYARKGISAKHIEGGEFARDAAAVGRVIPLWRRWRWAAVAALLVIGIGTALVVSVRHQHGMQPAMVRQSLPINVPAPQSNRATITLADGQRVALDSLAKGILAQQGNVRLVKLEDGRIAYEGTADGGLQYNTLYNPRGSKVVDVLLGDGTHVWLNSGSSIRYPVAFTGMDRAVTINGEAYFEVARDPGRPFLVSKGGLVVKVLGTHFNVNAYDDEEDIKVTLLEGSVAVGKVLLTPGQQAMADTLVHVNAHPDLEAVMAWKDGLFNFNKIPLQQAMRQLSRWYNVEIEYRGSVTTKTLGGEMQRDLSLPEVLDGLRDIGVRSRIEGKKVIVE